MWLLQYYLCLASITINKTNIFTQTHRFCFPNMIFSDSEVCVYLSESLKKKKCTYIHTHYLLYAESIYSKLALPRNMKTM